MASKRRKKQQPSVGGVWVGASMLCAGVVVALTLCSRESHDAARSSASKPTTKPVHAWQLTVQHQTSSPALPASDPSPIQSFVIRPRRRHPTISRPASTATPLQPVSTTRESPRDNAPAGRILSSFDDDTALPPASFKVIPRDRSTQ